MSEQVAEQVAQPDAAPMETPAEVAQGGSGNDFLTMIPEDIREHPSFGPIKDCLLYTSPSPRDGLLSRMPSSA